MQEKMKKNTENRRKRAKKGNSTRGNRPDPAKRYTRIGRIPGGAARLAIPAFNVGAIDKVTDARANGPHAEGGQARTKPPMSEPQTEAGNQIAL